MQVVDHLVVGGGVMGSAAAWQLARRGRDVVLLERFAPGHVNGASHGASRIYRQTYDRPEYLDLAAEALELWQSFDGVLTLTGGVSHGEPAPGVVDAFVARGVPHELLTPDAAHERWPGLRFEGTVLHETRTAGRLHADRAVDGAAVRGRRARCRRAARRAGAVRDPSRPTACSSRPPSGRSGPAASCWPSARGRPRCSGRTAPPLVVTQEQPAHFALRSGTPTTGRASRTGRSASTRGPAAPTAWGRPARGSRSASTPSAP